MFKLETACADPLVAIDHGRRRARTVGVVLRRLTLALAVGLILGGCSIPFGNGSEPTSRTPEETRRDRSRLYMEEQQRQERERMFDRVGPSDR